MACQQPWHPGHPRGGTLVVPAAGHIGSAPRRFRGHHRTTAPFCCLERSPCLPSCSLAQTCNHVHCVCVHQNTRSGNSAVIILGLRAGASAMTGGMLGLSALALNGRGVSCDGTVLSTAAGTHNQRRAHAEHATTSPVAQHGSSPLWNNFIVACCCHAAEQLPLLKERAWTPQPGR